MEIHVFYHSIDGYRATRRYKTLATAQAWATQLVGETPGVSGLGYAVSDGIGKVTVSGCTMRELFPKSWHPD